jgi:hypothetical protein
MSDTFSSLPVPGNASFLDIQRHFLERSLDMDALSTVLIGAGIVVGIILLVMLFLYLRPKENYVPQDWILEAAQIKELLSLTLTQRAKMELHFAVEGSSRRPALFCAPISIENSSLLLETSGLTTLSSKWLGWTVDCYFMLRKQESYSFYAFSAPIAEIQTRKDICYIKLPLPSRIESRQKRSYLRIVPPEEYLLGAAIWRGSDMPESLERNDLALWARPSRIWLPSVREEFTIRDISSGGIRLHLPRHILAEEMDYIHVSNQFIIMLDLWEPDKAQRLRLWLLCRMQSPVLDFETKGMNIGAQFLSWAKPAESGGSNLAWLKLASSGEIEPLGNWIMRRHLEIFRESEQALGFAQR